MRITTPIKVSQLVVDRQAIGPATYALAKHLEAGGTVPPIHVQYVGNGFYKVLQGRHRTLAFKLLGRDTILANLGIPSPGGDTCPDL